LENQSIQLNSFREPAAVTDKNLFILEMNRPFSELIACVLKDDRPVSLNELFTSDSGSIPVVPGHSQRLYLLNGTAEPRRGFTVFPVSFTGNNSAAFLLTFHPVEILVETHDYSARNDAITLELLLAGISHEINNPNSFISLNIPFLKEGFDKIFSILDRFELIKDKFRYNSLDYYEFKSEVYEVLEDMNVGSTRINDLVQEMKSFVLTDAIGGRDIIVLGAFLTSVTRFMKVHTNKKKIDVKISCPPELTVAASKEYLTKIVTNLVKNSADAAPSSGGIIQLTAKRKPGSPLMLEITDNGHGIEPSKLSEIFTPFYTTKTGVDGFGIGLPISKAMAEKMNFKLKVESSLGRGTKVTIEIPQEYVR